jgi:hypothetical protein
MWSRRGSSQLPASVFLNDDDAAAATTSTSCGRPGPLGGVGGGTAGLSSLDSRLSNLTPRHVSVMRDVTLGL